MIGTEGIGKCNSNDLLLLKKCVEHELLFTNTVFRLPTHNKASWMHPHSKHWHLIDYVIVSHKLSLCIQPAHRPQGKKVPKRLDVSKLKQDSKRQAFINDICSRLDAMELRSNDPEENWTIFRDTVHSSTADSLGPVSRKHQDWFDENDEDIKGHLEEKHQKYKAYLSGTCSVSNKAAYSDICKTVETRLRYMQDSLLSSKADEIQSFADRKDMKKFFDALKTVFSPQSSGPTPLLSADGTNLLTDKKTILKRWA